MKECYKCVFGEGGGTYGVRLGGRISPGAIIGWALGWYWWAEEGMSVRVALLGIIFQCPFHLGGSFFSRVPLGFPSDTFP